MAFHRRNKVWLVLLATSLSAPIAPATSPHERDGVPDRLQELAVATPAPSSPPVENGRRAMRVATDDHPTEISRFDDAPLLVSLSKRRVRRSDLETTLGNGSYGIPTRLVRAYKSAAAGTRQADPGCGLDWETLAGVGKVESNHAWGGRVDTRGNTTQPILGPVLDGSRFAAIPDTDGGRLDGDTQWDRAVGPMQFIPSSWIRFVTDGNGDGVASPHNVDDATRTAATHLCFGDVDLAEPSDLVSALYSYNHSEPYVRTVLGWIDAYRNGRVEPTTPPRHLISRTRSTGPRPAPSDSSAPATPDPKPTKPSPAPSSSPVPEATSTPSKPLPVIPIPSNPVPTIPVPTIPVPTIPVPTIPVPASPTPASPTPSSCPVLSLPISICVDAAGLSHSQ